MLQTIITPDSEFIDRGRDGGPEIDFEWGLFEAPDLEVVYDYIFYIYLQHIYIF